MSTREKQAFLVLLSMFLSGSVLLADRGGESDAGAAKEFDLNVVATLGKSIRGSEFFEVTYYVRGEKKRPEKKRALVKIPASVPFLRDRLGALKECKEGDVIRIFGKPEEREVFGAGGVAGRERIVKRGQVVVTGDLAVVPDYKDRKDRELKWSEAEVEQAGKGTNMKVLIEGASFHVSMNKSYKMVVREEIPEEVLAKLRSRLLRRGALLIVKAKSSSEKPELKGKDAELEAFEASRVILIDRRVQGYYGTLLRI